jgi:3-phenylpropionate/trans-cinnamate dioxygenase ferredoxin reductase subunit
MSVDTTSKIVVVGGGPAGTFAAIGAKKQNPAASVVLINDEPCEPYEKPPLSKAVLLGKVQPDDARIAGPQGLAGHHVTLETLAPCAAIDREARVVVLLDGRRIDFDALVIATGSAAREIPNLPKGTPRVHYLRTESDAHRLKADLLPGRHLLVVGGGLIGLEVAASAAALGLQVIVLEIAARVLARVCDNETGERVNAAHREHGVDIRTGTALLEATAQADGRIAVETSDGDRVIVDVVVVGTGSIPNDALAIMAGLAVDNGIVVDGECRTSDPHILAAGDVARFAGPHGPVRLENWRHAQEQGSVAGRNAAGAHDIYQTVPSFWSEQYDLYIQGVGWGAPDATRVRRPLDGNRALFFDVSEGRIVYAMGINAQRELASVRRLIERRVPIDPVALADPAKLLTAMLQQR